MSDRAIVIGIGNEFRGDDAVGILVARRLQKQIMDSAEVVEHDGEGVDLLHAWEPYDRVIIIDAVMSEDPVGTVQRMRIAADTLRLANYRCTSHNFALPEAVSLAATLNLLPKSLVVYGITGAEFALGAALSPGVAASIDPTVKMIVGELTSLRETVRALPLRRGIFEVDGKADIKGRTLTDN